MSQSAESRKLLFLYGICVAVSFFVLGYAFLVMHPRQPPLQKFRALPGFELVDQDGRPFGLGDLKGKVWLADFVYTTCPGPCPLVSHRMSQLQEEAFKDDDVRFVSFTVDPKTDTPAVLKAYAAQLHAAPGKWEFLTGDKEKIFEIVRQGFTLAVPSAAEKQLVHSTKLALVDRDGVVRGYYDGVGEDDSARIVEDIRRLSR